MNAILQRSSLVPARHSASTARTVSAATTPLIQRPLVVRCGAFGETVLLTALLAQLHARFGTPADVVASGPWAKPLLEGQHTVAEVFVVQSRNTPYWLERSQQQLVKWLRTRGEGPVWFCDAADPVRRLLTRAGIHDSHICDARSVQPHDEHHVDRWIRFANETPPAFRGRLPLPRSRVPSAATLDIAPSAATILEDWLVRRELTGRPYLVIQAGNKRTLRPLPRARSTNTKYWPEDHWAQVVRALRELHPDHAILLLGVGHEYRMNAQIARLADVADVHNVADDLPIPVLLPLLQLATGMIAVDTGPTHAAAALGCPTVALFGTQDPRAYRPGGTTTPAVALTGEWHGKPSMLGIEPAEVMAAWRTLQAATRRQLAHSQPLRRRQAG